MYCRTVLSEVPMRKMLDDTLSLYANNVYVYLFKRLVYDAAHEELPKNENGERTAILDMDLYSKAINLPEAETVTFEKISENSNIKYGKFSGGTVYKTFNGDIDEEKKNVAECEGWLILDNSSEEYALFNTNNDETYIISKSSFTARELVKDFSPLYEKLNSLAKNENSKNKYLVENDTDYVTSQAVTFRDGLSNAITDYTKGEYNIVTSASSGSTDYHEQDGSRYDKAMAVLGHIDTCGKVKLYQAWLMYMDAMLLWEELAIFGKSAADRLEMLNNGNAEIRGAHGVYPAQLDRLKGKEAYKTAMSEVQAVIYAIPDENAKKDLAKETDSVIDPLLCYQNPESLSYTAAAQYEPVQTRGTQMPVQYYNMANAMELSFTLKWHIDEISTFVGDGDKPYYANGLASVAEIAERLTRPWEVKGEGDAVGSNKRKLCQVILPSIVARGYITQANITYSGDMTGTSAGIIKSKAEDAGQHDGLGGLVGALTIENNKKSSYSIGNVDDTGFGFTTYGYTQLEVTFNMILVKDVTLLPVKGDEGTAYNTMPTVGQNTYIKDQSPLDVLEEIARLGIETAGVAENIADAATRMYDAGKELFSV